MEFKSIEKREEGKFITRYNLLYETRDHKEKVYEIISRNKNLTSFSELHDKSADAVVLIMHDEKNEKVLLNREYRMAVGEEVINFPAGLIDPGEDMDTAAKRELFEETGLTIKEIKDRIFDSYSAVGFSNEKNVCIVGIAEGTIRESDSTLEEIEAKWYTKEEVRNLLKNQMFAARTQAYCYLWSKS